jgi:hypothetical protein
MSAGMRAVRTTARPGMAGLTRRAGGKSHPPKDATHRRQRKCQREWKGTFFLVRSPRVRLGVRLQRAVPAAPPGAGASPRLVDRHIVLLRCCILLHQGLELRAQDFEFISLTWGGATGIRTPDLLHAMQLKGVAGCGTTSSFSRSTSLVMALYRRPLAPRLAPQRPPITASPTAAARAWPGRWAGARPLPPGGSANGSDARPEPGPARRMPGAPIRAGGRRRRDDHAITVDLVRCR